MDSTITIPDPDDKLRDRLERRAASHGRSVEVEARAILVAALATDEPPIGNLADAIRAIVEPLGGLEIPELQDVYLQTKDLPQFD